MVMLLTGLFMAAVPVGCTRKDARKDKDAVKKTRTMGIWLAAAAAIWLICSAI
ncbi:MAG: permease [Roseburia sp.]|nr:permease [Roseburia sp.]